VGKSEALPSAPFNLIQKKTPSVIPNEYWKFFEDLSALEQRLKKSDMDMLRWAQKAVSTLHGYLITLALPSVYFVLYF